MNTQTFTNRTKVETIKKGEHTVIIMKAVKENTNRVFFYPETVEGKRINATMFARLYDAVGLAKIYFTHLDKKATI